MPTSSSLSFFLTGSEKLTSDASNVVVPSDIHLADTGFSLLESLAFFADSRSSSSAGRLRPEMERAEEGAMTTT